MTAAALVALAVTILFGALVSGTPLLFATVGEIVAERSGVMNLGIEGMMLMGAMGGFAVWTNTGNLPLGLLAGALLGGVLALLHAFVTITPARRSGGQRPGGHFLGRRPSSILGGAYVGKQPPTPTPIFLPLVTRVALVEQIIIIIVGVAGGAGGLVLRQPHPAQAFNLRSVGEYPAAANTLGINVYRIRYAYVILAACSAAWAAPP